jgi:hypothetical protein
MNSILLSLALQSSVTIPAFLLGYLVHLCLVYSMIWLSLILPPLLHDC